MSIKQSEVLKIGHLARLELTPDEAASLEGDLNAILAYVDQLNELDTSGIATTEHAAEAGDTYREDKPGTSLPNEQALAGAPDSKDGCFQVPKIIE